jgi:hypothetical protein
LRHPDRKLTVVVQRVQGEVDVTTYMPHREPRLLRVWLALFALAALTMLLAAGWLRFFVPAVRHASRVRDVGWLQKTTH